MSELMNGYNAQRVDDMEGLHEWLSGLNDAGVDACVILPIRTQAYDIGPVLAYCTDPDGEWFIETGDPIERFNGIDETYDRFALDQIKGNAPYLIFYAVDPK